MLARQPANLPHSLLKESSSSSSPPLIPCSVPLPDADVRNDSGVSTMKSICSNEVELAVPLTVLSTATTINTVQTLADILYSNHNNNYTGTVDVVELLQLHSVDDEQNQLSNSSSLESLASLENRQGSEVAVADGGSGTTSCSDDSFEMSSTCSVNDTDISLSLYNEPSETHITTSQHDVVDRDVRETTCESFCSTESEQNNTAASAETSCSGNAEDRYPNLLLLRQPPSSISMDSFMLIFAQLCCSTEHNYFSSGLPVLDFVKLEEQLTNAAREREEYDRKLLGEEVRRRLALQADSWKGASPAISTRPNRSNLALRLQNAMNLQVCYMNELAESASEKSEISESEDEFIVPRSRSTPDLKGASRPGSSKEDPYLQKLRDQAVHDKHLDQFERQALLNGETRNVLKKAKKVADMTLQQYRSTKSKASDVPRQARQYLRKMSVNEVLQIKATIEEAIDRKNFELVELLIERDSLHMEHDSLLVDIEDFTEHEAECSALDFPYLLSVMDGRIPPESHYTGTTASWNNSSFGANVTSSHSNASTATPTPTSPSRTLVAHLPKSLTRLVLFRR
ncbi:hypothetical protein DICVIV_05101 [Dictyocaulus viviparus]|uniref:Schwannomin interacting protein 1 C-terminal domain-containing protein n=1 Tax=Dictyocaulus viviparus TaxID=29172 RepID=A0A0D8Y2H9_DICVI|nr:hypothetical protein DICVIV_05101 [Dictyocaulus viviparus]